MCRNIVEGGRRCPCTSGPYRSAARYARLARQTAEGEGVGPSTGNTAVLDRPGFDLDRVQDVAARVKDALDHIRPLEEDREVTLAWRARHNALIEEFGSIEQASTWVGNQIREEAERRAGVDPAAAAATLAEKVKQARDTYALARTVYEKADVALQGVRRDIMNDPDRHVTTDPVLAEAKEAREQARQLMSEASMGNSLARVGHDDESRDAMTRLASAYREVLAEVRPMGGQLGWHEKTSKDARELFQSAAENYPTDWIDKAGQGDQPIGKVTRSRAHYARNKFAETRKRTPVSYNVAFQSTSAEDVAQQIDARMSGDERIGITDEERARAMRAAEETPGARVEVSFVAYEARAVYSEDPERDKPRGRGWELHDVEMYNGTRKYWRRQRTRMATVSGVSAPEITTDRDPARVNDKPLGYSTATHELAHRMEHKVPGIARLEREFLDRRTQGEELTRIYKNSRGNTEVGYADDLPLHYAGKVYRDRDGVDSAQHYELLSCATQGMFGGDHGGLVGLHGDGTQYSRDDDYRSWALGVLASV